MKIFFSISLLVSFLKVSRGSSRIASPGHIASDFIAISYSSSPHPDRSFLNASFVIWNAHNLPCTLDLLPNLTKHEYSDEFGLLFIGYPRCFPDDIARLVSGTDVSFLLTGLQLDLGGTESVGYRAKQYWKTKSPLPIFETNLLWPQYDVFAIGTVDLIPASNPFDDTGFMASYISLIVVGYALNTWKLVYTALLARNHYTETGKFTTALKVMAIEAVSSVMFLALMIDYYGMLELLSWAMVAPLTYFPPVLTISSSYLLAHAMHTSMEEIEETTQRARVKHKVIVAVLALDCVLSVFMILSFWYIVPQDENMAIVPAVVNLTYQVLQIMIGIELFKAKKTVVKVLQESQDVVVTEERNRVNRMATMMYYSAGSTAVYVLVYVAMLVIVVATASFKATILCLGVTLNALSVTGLVQVYAFPFHPQV